MKYAFVAAALVAAVSAQDLSEIPTCALACINTAVEDDSTCSVTDYVCVCDNISTLQGDATSCVVSACGADVAVSSVLPAVSTFCIEVSESVATATATAASTTTTAAAATTTTAAAGGATTTSVASTASVASTYGTSSSAAATYSVATTSSTSAYPTYSAKNSTATPTAVVTAGAAAGAAGSLGLLALGVLVAAL